MITFEVRALFLTAEDLEVVSDADSRHGTGSILINAAKKADALAVLDSYGYKIAPAHCRIATGRGMEALNDAGVIGATELTLVGSNGRRIGKVHRNERGERATEYIGEVLVDKDDSFKYSFVPASS